MFSWSPGLTQYTFVTQRLGESPWNEDNYKRLCNAQEELIKTPLNEDFFSDWKAKIEKQVMANPDYWLMLDSANWDDQHLAGQSHFNTNFTRYWPRGLAEILEKDRNPHRGSEALLNCLTHHANPFQNFFLKDAGEGPAAEYEQIRSFATLFLEFYDQRLYADALTPEFCQSYLEKIITLCHVLKQSKVQSTDQNPTPVHNAVSELGYFLKIMLPRYEQFTKEQQDSLSEILGNALFIVLIENKIPKTRLKTENNVEPVTLSLSDLIQGLASLMALTQECMKNGKIPQAKQAHFWSRPDPSTTLSLLKYHLLIMARNSGNPKAFFQSHSELLKPLIETHNVDRKHYTQSKTAQLVQKILNGNDNGMTLLNAKIAEKERSVPLLNRYKHQ